MSSKTYERIKREEERDRLLKESIRRGESEAKQDAIIEKYAEQKPKPEGVAL